jgi:hypothetical protein
MPQDKGQMFTEEETALRRDEVVRRMANTPPQPRTKVQVRRPRKGKKAGEDRAAGKGYAGRAP